MAGLMSSIADVAGSYHSISKGTFLGGGVFGYPIEAASPSQPSVARHLEKAGVDPLSRSTLSQIAPQPPLGLHWYPL